MSSELKEDCTLRVDGRDVQTLIFPGGECHVNIENISAVRQVHVAAVLTNSDSIMKLLLLIDALRRKSPSIKIELAIPYLPYARQDRVCNPGEPLSIKVMANLINMLNCEKVVLYDPHSDVSGALINNCTIVSLSEILVSTRFCEFIHNNQLMIVSPDAGSEKKVREVARRLHAPIIYASKVRDTATGQITSCEIKGTVQGSNVIILDDICDGGASFIELAKKLQEDGAVNVYLYVTHGIFSKGIEPLKPYFKHIFCYHALNPSVLESDILTVLSGK